MLEITTKSILSLFCHAFFGSLCLFLISDDDKNDRWESKVLWGFVLLFYIMLNIIKEIIILAIVYKKKTNALTGLGSVVLSIILSLTNFIYFVLVLVILARRYQTLNIIEKILDYSILLWTFYPIFFMVISKFKQIIHRLTYERQTVGQKKFTLMSWNIQRGLNHNWKYELDKTLEYIIQVNPDILCLQEADTGQDFVKIKKLAEDLKSQLVQTYKANEEVVIISKFPVEAIDVLYFNSKGNAELPIESADKQDGSNYFQEKEYLLSSLIRLDEYSRKKIWISVTHTDSFWTLGPACKQMLLSLNHIQNLEDNKGLTAKTFIGDLNMPASALIHQIFSSIMIDCWSSSGLGFFGWTASIGSLGRKIKALAHNVRLDYIYLKKPSSSKNVLILGKTTLGEEFLSDHRAVISEIFY